MRRRNVLFLLCVVSCIGFAATVYAQPLTYTQNLKFHAPEQSFWGPGGSHASFYDSGKIGGGVGVKYQVAASTGTVKANYQGGFSADYNDYLMRPGTTNLSLGFTGHRNRGTIDTYLGASVDVDWFVDLNMPWPIPDINERGNLYSANYGLGINERFDPRFGRTIFGSDDFTALNISAGIPIIDVGLDFDIEQTARFRADAVRGMVLSKHRNSGYKTLSAFSITNDLIDTSLSIDLPYSGYWDLTFVDMELMNRFKTGFDLNLVPYVEVDIGVWDKRWDWTVGIDLYDTPYFGLDFNKINDSSGFAILVPEPSTGILLVTGLLALVGSRRRSKK